MNKLNEAITALAGARPTAPRIPLPGTPGGPPSHAAYMERLAKQGIAASLAGGIIAASGKPHTPAEAVKVLHEVLDQLYPKPAEPEGE